MKIVFHERRGICSSNQAVKQELFLYSIRPYYTTVPIFLHLNERSLLGSYLI